MSDISLAMLRERNITVQKYEYCPSERATIREPEVIVVTLTNARGESFQAKTFCSKRDHVLRPDEYIQLVIDRYHETEEHAFKRSWQYKLWGEPIYRLSPRLAQPGYGGRCGNEFDYYHYDPGWYIHNIRKPVESFRKRFELFAS
jgi:hypothetical protein